jgi:hypothetical protein
MTDVDENFKEVSDDLETKPTKENMVEALEWLVEDARAGDSLVLTFAGHGTQVPDWKGDEQDGWDEAICPTDYEGFEMGLVPYKVITDNYLHNMLRKLPKDVLFTGLFDCCHSGTILDLPFNIREQGSAVKAIEQQNQIAAEHDHLGARGLNLANRRCPLESERPIFHRIFGGCCQAFRRTSRLQQKLDIEAAVVCISGCKDLQTSLDANLQGKQRGILTFCLQQALDSFRYNCTAGQLFRQAEVGGDSLRRMIKEIDQVFQMSFSRNARPFHSQIFDAQSAARAAKTLSDASMAEQVKVDLPRMNFMDVQNRDDLLKLMNEGKDSLTRIKALSNPMHPTNVKLRAKNRMRKMRSSSFCSQC